MLLLLGLVCRFACFALLRVSRLSVRVGLLSAHLLSKKLSPRRDGLTCQTTRLAQDTGARPKPASARGDAPARRAGWGVSAVRHQQRPGAARAAAKAGPAGYGASALDGAFFGALPRAYRRASRAFTGTLSRAQGRDSACAHRCASRAHTGALPRALRRVSARPHRRASVHTSRHASARPATS